MSNFTSDLKICYQGRMNYTLCPNFLTYKMCVMETTCLIEFCVAGELSNPKNPFYAQLILKLIFLE